MHAIYERITVAGPDIVGVRLTAAAYAHGLALAFPEKVEMARLTGVGRAITTYSMPIEGRDEWLVSAAARVVGIRPSTAKRHLADLRARSDSYDRSSGSISGRAEGMARRPEPWAPLTNESGARGGVVLNPPPLIWETAPRTDGRTSADGSVDDLRSVARSPATSIRHQPLNAGDRMKARCGC